MTASTFALVDTVQLEVLAVYLRRRLLRPSPCRYSSTRGARYPHLATTTSAFTLVVTVRLEWLAVYLR